jgi:hypothetical protein
MIAILSRLFRPQRGEEPAWIDTVELQRRIASGAAVVLFDMSQPEEYTSPPGHLPGAINVPLGDLPGRTAEFAACRNWDGAELCQRGRCHHLVTVSKHFNTEQKGGPQRTLRSSSCTQVICPE